MNGPSLTKEQAYATLGLTADASMEEVSARYKLLMKTVHPDVAGDGLTEYTSRLTLAYQAIRRQDFAEGIPYIGNYQKNGTKNEPAADSQPTARNTYGYYTKSPDGTPFGYEKSYYYDGEAFGRPTREDTKVHRDAENRIIALKRVLLPIAYNMLTVLTRVSLAVTIFSGVIFILTVLSGRGYGANSFTYLLIGLVCTVLTILLKAAVYKNGRKDFEWTQEFRI